MSPVWAAQLGFWLRWSCPDYGTSLLVSAFMSSIVDSGRPEILSRLIAVREHEAGGVAMVVKGLIRARAECSCGWQGSGHVLSAVAVHHALVHAAVHRCQARVPLVV
jgi:hypothetical protein